LTRDERDEIGNFLELCADWGDIGADLGPKAEMDTASDLDDQLRTLDALGFVVLGARRPLTLVTGEGDDSSWIDAAIVIRRLVELADVEVADEQTQHGVPSS
jgi:hypothetical protein